MKIEKINIDLLSEFTEEKYEKERTKHISDYNKKRAEYIDEYTEYKSGYSTGGFFGSWIEGKEVKDPVGGEASWNTIYPDGHDWNGKYSNGYNSWRSNQVSLTAFGEQELIDKINELIDVLNKPKDRKKNDKD